MCRLSHFVAAGLLSILWLSSVQAAAPKSADSETCGEYGTSVHFEKTPSDAAAKARKEEKLVFVLHVSGDFENPEFT